jgi:hypothetical protein
MMIPSHVHGRLLHAALLWSLAAAASAAQAPQDDDWIFQERGFCVTTKSGVPGSWVVVAEGPSNAWCVGPGKVFVTIRKLPPASHDSPDGSPEVDLVVCRSSPIPPNYQNHGPARSIRCSGLGNNGVRISTRFSYDAFSYAQTWWLCRADAAVPAGWVMGKDIGEWRSECRGTGYGIVRVPPGKPAAAGKPVYSVPVCDSSPIPAGYWVVQVQYDRGCKNLTPTKANGKLIGTQWP